MFLSAALALALVVMQAQRSAAEASAHDVGWPHYGNDDGDTHYSPLVQIKLDNIDHLHVAYAFPLGVLRSNESTPVVIGDTMYVTSSWGPRFVYALDAATGAMRWRYRSQVPESVIQYACCDVGNRGVAYSDGKVFVGQLDGKLVALDAKTGKLLWKSTVVDYTEGAVITSPPLVVGHKVITGFAGGEYGVRGYLSAFDAATGKLLWRTYTVPAPGEPGAETWKGDSWKHGGGAAWLVGSYDPKLNMIYYGTSNPAPSNSAERSLNKPDDKFTNLYTCSELALNPESGKILWHFQYTPTDTWDYDGTNDPVLADLTIDGTAVPALLHGDRNGFFYVLDRRTGRLISADPFVRVTWAKAIDLESGRPMGIAEMRPSTSHEARDICPGSIGGKNWQPMSYNPRTGLVYMTANNLCMNLKENKVQFHRGTFYIGVDKFDLSPGPGDYQGEVIAWNPVTHSRVWSVKEPLWYVGGVLSTGSGLVFYGTFDGWFKALDGTGKELWRFRVGSGVGPGPITYEIGGKQYIAIVVGRSVTIPNWFGKFGAKAAAKTPESGMLFVFTL
jgi:PQQ-dependent dehydrogenase (methanol/ethanol family)